LQTFFWQEELKVQTAVAQQRDWHCALEVHDGKHAAAWKMSGNALVASEAGAGARMSVREICGVGSGEAADAALQAGKATGVRRSRIPRNLTLILHLLAVRLRFSLADLGDGSQEILV
jgi:hypothetical protein